MSGSKRSRSMLKALPTWYRVSVLALVTVFVVAMFFIYATTWSTVQSNFQAYLDREVVNRADALREDFAAHRRNLRFLHATPPVNGIVRATANGGVDPYDGTTLAQWKARLETIFSAFARNVPDVDQIRFVSAEDGGRELVRVEREGDGVKVVPAAMLQQTGEQPYFRRLQRAAPGAILVSDVEYNRAFGKLESPYVPTYRVGMAVYDDTGELFGVVILNIDARRMLEDFAEGLLETANLYLLNDGGQFLVHPNRQYSFDFETGAGTVWDDLFSPVASSPDQLLQRVDGRGGDSLYYKTRDVQLSSINGEQWVRVVLGVPGTVVIDSLLQRLKVSTLVLVVLLLVLVVAMTVYQYQLSIKYRLLAAQAQFKAIFDGSNDAIVVADDNGDVVEVNGAAETLFLRPRRELIGINFRQTFVAAEEGLQAWGVATQQSPQEPIDVLLRDGEGRHIDTSISVSAVDNGGDGGKKTALLIRDVSRQKQMERQIQQANLDLEDQVARRTRELEMARNEAVDANRAKSRFLANMSHEIRTPMNGVFGMLNLLRREPLNEQQAHYLAMAESSVGALTTLINDILDFSKIEAGKLDLAPERFDLLQFLHFSVTSLAVLAQQKDLELVVDLAGIDHRHAIGDRMRLGQVITNLLSNAIKFTDAGEVVLTASTEACDGAILFRCQVMDTGMGISSEAQSRLFRIFEQESGETATQFGGTGLGLAISRKLVTLMGGDMEVTSAKGEGSTFSFTVLLDPCESVPLAAIDLSGVGTAVLESNRQGRDALLRILRRWGGRCSAPEGLAKISSDISSAELVVADSFHLNQRLDLFDRREAGDSQGLVVAMRNVHGSEEDSLPESAEGMVVIDKPITPVNLFRALAGHFPASDTPEVAAGDNGQVRSLAGITVLAVDDHLINREVTAGMLQTSGATVLLAENGQKAIDILLDNRDVGLVLLDCQMPVMDGYQAAREIRGGAAGRNYIRVPIVALTAGALSDDREKCIRAGMNDYISKPVRSEDLIEKVYAWSHRPISTASFVAPSIPLATAPKAVPEIAVAEDLWQRQHAIKRMADNEALFRKIVAMYVDSAPNAMAALTGAVEAGNAEDIAKYAHQLKGIANNVGLYPLGEGFAAMERAARREVSEVDAVLWQALRRQFEESLVMLEAYLAPAYCAGDS